MQRFARESSLAPALEPPAHPDAISRRWLARRCRAEGRLLATRTSLLLLGDRPGGSIEARRRSAYCGSAVHDGAYCPGSWCSIVSVLRHGKRRRRWTSARRVCSYSSTICPDPSSVRSRARSRASVTASSGTRRAWAGSALLDGRALTASELALAAQIRPQ